MEQIERMVHKRLSDESKSGGEGEQTSAAADNGEDSAAEEEVSGGYRTHDALNYGPGAAEDHALKSSV